MKKTKMKMIIEGATVHSAPKVAKAIVVAKDFESGGETEY